ncbi:hypothetical protein HKD37_02G003336 [Glycine soja]
MPWLPTIKASAFSTAAAASATTTKSPSFHAAIPSQMTNLPTPKTTSTASSTANVALPGGAIPRHVSKSATPKARSASATTSNAYTAAASAHAISREVAEPTAIETTTAAAASAATRITAPVAIPGEVSKLATLVARGAASAIAPGAETEARAGGAVVVAGGCAGLERGAVDAGDVDGLGLVVVAGGDGELDAVALEEGAVAVGSDGGLVNEEILAAVVGLDEAEALAIVEPLHHARESLFRHRNRFDFLDPTNPRNRASRGGMPTTEHFLWSLYIYVRGELKFQGIYKSNPTLPITVNHFFKGC